MSIGKDPNNIDESRVERTLEKALQALNRPDILIEESKASTQSFQDYKRIRRKTGQDKSIELFNPLSQSNSNLQKIEDLYDIVEPNTIEEKEDKSNASRYRRIFS